MWHLPTGLIGHPGWGHFVEPCPLRSIPYGLATGVGPFHVSPFLRIRIQIVTIFIQSGPRTAVDPG
eukprot:COSAG01_NODE_21405_length_902_cov_6.993781_1_plen_65_part_10